MGRTIFKGDKPFDVSDWRMLHHVRLMIGMLMNQMGIRGVTRVLCREEVHLCIVLQNWASLA